MLSGSRLGCVAASFSEGQIHPMSERPRRLDFELPASKRALLDDMATNVGVSRGALVRIALDQLLAGSGLILKVKRYGQPDEFAAFLDELRVAPERPPAEVVDALATTFDQLDREADGNPGAAALSEVLAIIARAVGPVGERLAIMRKIVGLPGQVEMRIPAALLHPAKGN